jgi:hypothetical protein
MEDVFAFVTPDYNALYKDEANWAVEFDGNKSEPFYLSTD